MLNPSRAVIGRAFSTGCPLQFSITVQIMPRPVQPPPPPFLQLIWAERQSGSVL
jgi:hypothetical protein